MKKTLWSLIVVVALAITAAGLYLWFEAERPEPQVAPPPPPLEEPGIRHPIEAAAPPDETGAETAEPLPVLADSDGAMREALAGLFGRKLEEFFNLQEILYLTSFGNHPIGQAQAIGFSLLNHLKRDGGDPL